MLDVCVGGWRADSTTATRYYMTLLSETALTGAVETNSIFHAEGSLRVHLAVRIF